jgi:hypothetical protein
MRAPVTLAAAAVACVALGAASAGAAKAPAATKWVDRPYGYSVILPADWYVIPRTKAGIESVIATLKAQKKTSLETAYRAILKTPESLSELKVYRFQAFLWPPVQSLVPTEFSLQVVNGSHAYTAKNLPAIADEYANAFSSNKGARITVPRKVKLGAGTAEVIDGSIPTGQATTGLEVYILAHGKRVYVLSFKIDASVLAKATVFRSIADHFAFL